MKTYRVTRAALNVKNLQHASRPGHAVRKGQLSLLGRQNMFVAGGLSLPMSQISRGRGLRKLAET